MLSNEKVPKPLSCQNKRESSISIVSESKIKLAIDQEFKSTPIQIGLPGLNSNIVVSKDKETHYEFILSTVSNEIQENIFTNVTTIDPRYVIVN